MEFKAGDKVFIRWLGGNSGEYILCAYYGKYYVEDSFTGEPNIKAGEVFIDTESVELVDD
tara:strand:- start:2625 stop:2804 length:180 start_codon:yes stop_codon:yes gene_type:complete